MVLFSHFLPLMFAPLFPLSLASDCNDIKRKQTPTRANLGGSRRRHGHRTDGCNCPIRKQAPSSHVLPLPLSPRRFAARRSSWRELWSSSQRVGPREEVIALAWIGRSTLRQIYHRFNQWLGWIEWIEWTGLVSASTAQIAIRHHFLNSASRRFDPGAVVIRLTRSASQTRRVQHLGGVGIHTTVPEVRTDHIASPAHGDNLTLY